MAQQDAPQSLAQQCFSTCADTPRPGVTFYNMQPLLNAPGLQSVVTHNLTTALRSMLGAGAPAPAQMPTHVLALETRGYFPGVWLAQALGVPLVPVRKYAQAKRLERDPERDLVGSHSYDTEYSAADARLCVRRGALPPGACCLVVDDVYATGGSARAACQVAAACGATVAACAVLLYVEACAAQAPAADVPVLSAFIADAAGALRDHCAPLALAPCMPSEAVSCIAVSKTPTTRTLHDVSLALAGIDNASGSYQFEAAGVAVKQGLYGEYVHGSTESEPAPGEPFVFVTIDSADTGEDTDADRHTALRLRKHADVFTVVRAGRNDKYVFFYLRIAHALHGVARELYTAVCEDKLENGLVPQTLIDALVRCGI